jgi:hypothetical protein
MANAEISKAVLGETLTTEIGDKGSYDAAKAHNLVWEDLATADRRRISAAFNRLAVVYTFYNFGAEVVAPQFEFVQDEDLQKERAVWDKELYGIGWRPRKGSLPGNTASLKRILICPGFLKTPVALQGLGWSNLIPVGVESLVPVCSVG